MVSVSLSVMSDSLQPTPWTVARQAPLSMGFPRQEYWSGLPFAFPGDFPNSGIKPGPPSLQADSLPSEPPWKPVFFFENKRLFPYRNKEIQKGKKKKPIAKANIWQRNCMYHLNKLVKRIEDYSKQLRDRLEDIKHDIQHTKHLEVM